MPATAGRVRMPANNRVHSSAALQTHGIWQSAIGYDPYAPNKDENTKSSSQPQSLTAEPEGENAYASFQGLLALARITGSNADEARGSCKKCGRVGHLTFQCRNFLSLKDKNDSKKKNPDAFQGVGLSVLDKLKKNEGGKNGKMVEESETSEEEESVSSDSDVDSELERIIAKRYGKKGSIKKKSSRKKDSDDDGSDSDLGSGKGKRRESSKKTKKRRRESVSSEEDEGQKKKQREKRRKRDDEDRERRRKNRKKQRRSRRSHQYSDDSDSDAHNDSGRPRKHKKRSSKSSDYDVSGSDNSQVRRRIKKSEKRSRKCHHEEK